MAEMDVLTVFSNQACRAKAITADFDLVDCFTPDRQCEYAMHFGDGFFCRHPQRKDIVNRTETASGDATGQAARFLTG